MFRRRRRQSLPLQVRLAPSEEAYAFDDGENRRDDSQRKSTGSRHYVRRIKCMLTGVTSAGRTTADEYAALRLPDQLSRIHLRLSMADELPSRTFRRRGRWRSRRFSRRDLLSEWRPRQLHSSAVGDDRGP